MQGAQARTSGGLLQRRGIGVAHQQAAQFVVHHQQFGDRAAAVVAAFGAGAVEQDRALIGETLQAMFLDQLRRRFEGDAGRRGPGAAPGAARGRR